MGSGPQTTSNSSSSTQPWLAAQPQLQSLLGKLGGLNTDVTGNQSAAANSLVGAASGLPNFSGAAGGAASGLLGGGGANQYAPMLQGAYGNLQSSLSGLTNPANLNPYNTPGFSQALSTMNNDIGNQVNDRFAAAGRDLSPGNSTALARGLSQGEGSLLQSQYNQNASNLMGASNSLYGAGAGTAQGLTGFNQLGNQNQLAGAGLAGQIPGLALQPGQAQLGAANTQQGLPGQNLGAYSNLLTPLAQLGSQSNGTQTQQTQVPAWQQALQVAGTLGPMVMGFAEGGNPPVGQPSIVGEKGPEVFVPNQPGTVLPHGFLESLMRFLPGQSLGGPAMTTGARYNSGR